MDTIEKPPITTTKLVSWFKLELEESFHELDATLSFDDIREVAQRRCQAPPVCTQVKRIPGLGQMPGPPL